MLNFSESALSSLKMSNLIDNILDLKEKVIVDAGLHKLCDQNSKLTEKMSHTTSENKKTSN